MKLNRYFAAAVSLLFWGNTALAQTGQPLSFEEALSITLKENLQITALDYQEKAAEQTRASYRGLRLPQLSAGATYVHMGKDIDFNLNDTKSGVQSGMTSILGSLQQAGIQLPPALLQGINGMTQSLMARDWRLAIQDQDAVVIGGTLKMPLYMGGKINAANRAAEINRQTVGKEGDQTRNALMSEVVQRYYGVVLANQVVKVRQQVLDGMQHHLDDAIKLENAGIIAKGERLYAEYKKSEAQRELENAKLQAETIANALGNTLNRTANYLPISTLFYLTQLESVEFFKESADKNNPLLNQVTLKKNLAEQGVKLQRSEFFPHLAAVGVASFYDHKLTNSLPRWAVGASLSINIFDGLSREKKYSAARNTVRQVESLESKARQDIAILIEKLYDQLTNYRLQMSSMDASIRFATEYYRVKEQAFSEGMASASDMIDAQLNLAKSRIERMQNAYNYEVALAQLLEAAGISERFGDYMRRSESSAVKFE